MYGVEMMNVVTRVEGGVVETLLKGQWRNKKVEYLKR